MLARYHENRRDKKNRKQKDDAKFRGPVHTNDLSLQFLVGARQAVPVAARTYA
jgi:hypothetical protein